MKHRTGRRAPVPRRQKARRGLCLALCLLLAASQLAAPALAAGELIAANSTRAHGTLTNLVIAVRFRNTTDTQDLMRQPEKWRTVRSLYDTDAESFSKYIEVVSGGALTVQNCFPQETSGAAAASFGLRANGPEEQPAEDPLWEEPGEAEASDEAETPAPQPEAAPGLPPEAEETEPPAEPTAEPAAETEETEASAESKTGHASEPAAGAQAEALPAIQPAPPAMQTDAVPGRRAAQTTAAASADPYCNTLQLQHDEAYYAGNNESAMVREIIEALANSTIPLPGNVKFDNDSPGVLDNLTILLPKLNDQTANFPASHSASYAGSESFNRLTVATYNLMRQNDLTASTSYPTVIIHEFLHTLGLPDLYRGRSEGGTKAPVGIWSIMSRTLPHPQYPLEVLREQLGWIPTIPTLTQTQTVTIRLPSVQDRWDGQYPTAYKIRTPLSDTEYFVAEYRGMGKGSFDKDFLGSPGGLLLYRVDEATSEKSNFNGENYIYVFRPRQAGKTEINDVASYAGDAPLWPEPYRDGSGNSRPGRTSYGSTDLSADCRGQDLLFYSSGKNSGVAIRGISLSDDKQLLTFTVEFAAYDQEELWPSVGAPVVGAASNGVSLAADGSALYTTHTVPRGTTLTLRRYTEQGGWSDAASLSGLSINPSADLAVYHGEVWLATTNSGLFPSVYKYAGGSLVQQYTALDGNINEFQLAEYQDSLYLAYCKDGNKTLTFVRLAGSGPAVPDLSVSNYLSNPALCEYGGKLAAVYSDQPLMGSSGAGNASWVALFDGSGWTPLLDTGVKLGNLHAAAANGAQLAVYAGINTEVQSSEGVRVYDGSGWKQLGGLPDDIKSLQLVYNGQKLYACTLEGAQNQRLRFRYWDGAAWQMLGGDIAESVVGGSLETAVVGRDFYLAYVTANNTLTVRRHGGAAPVTPPVPVDPVAPDYTVRLPLGSTAARETVYADGVAYQAVCSGGTAQLTLPDGAARTITWYPTNASGVPTGMRVWLLRYVNNGYVAAEQTALKDLLTYHGFSIRISGNAGIRFKTGISAAAKNALRSSAGLDGFHLVEYGTLVMNQKYAGTSPFVLGSGKVARGRSFWTENGKTNDYVFETVDGRQRFTSVLVDLPPEKYKVEYAFRGYIILEKNDQTYTLYGPPLARSICYLADRLISRGEYAAGSREDAFLRGILAQAK